MERLILAAKRIGFSMEELRGQTMDEALTFIDLSLPQDHKSKKGKKRKKATQADIDRFLL